MSLKDAKAGDVVAVRRYGIPVKRTIDRITPTQVIVDGFRYWREGSIYVSPGTQVGGQGRCELWTEKHDAQLVEHDADMKHAAACHKLRDYRWREAPREVVAAALALIEGAKP